MREKSDIPPRSRATELVKSLIRDGNLSPHDKLPSERELSERWGINRITLHHAIQRLVATGDLYTVRGAGSYVAESRVTLELKRTVGFSDSVVAAGHVPTSRILDTPLFGVDEEILSLLEAESADELFVLTRVRLVDGAAVALEETRLKISQFPGIDAQDFATGSLYAWLKRSFGVEAAHDDARVTLVELEDTPAGLLGVPAGTAAFRRAGVVYDENERPVECYRSLLLPRYFEYASDLTRRIEPASGVSPDSPVAPSAANASFAPKYVQLARAVRAAIEAGEYPLGQAIPTERELVAQYGINRLTVRAGISSLVEEGLLERVQGKGVFVRKPRGDANLNEIGGFRLSAEEDATRRLSRRVLGLSRRPAGPWYAGVFAVAADDELFSTRVLTLVDGEPRSLEETLVPVSVAPSFADYDGSLFNADEVLDFCGVTVMSASELLSTVTLEQRDARLFGLDAGACALVLRCTEYDARGRAVEVSTSITPHPGRGYQTSY